MKQTIGQVGFALLLSASTIAIFSHGLFGAGPFFTAAYLIATTGLLVLLGRWSAVALTTADYLALVMFAVCAVSIAQHPPASRGDIALLILSFAAYPAARGLAHPVRGRAFVLTLSTIVGAGTIATAVAFGTQPSVQHGRPMIFGLYDHAPIQFTVLLAMGLFSLACSRMRVALIAAMIAIPIAVFAASQVRFVFVALLGTLVFGAIVASGRRVRFAAIAGVVIASIFVGALSRIEMTMVYVKYAEDSFGLLTTTSAATANVSSMPSMPSMPSTSSASNVSPAPPPILPVERCPQTNLNNSIAVRMQLYKEAISLFPSAGLTGIGLGAFKELSCVNSEPHNSFLQTSIEFGIPAGMLFVALISVVGLSLLLRAASNPEALFALCSLSFAVLMALAYGHINQDGPIFLTLGYGAAIASTGPHKLLARALPRRGPLGRL